MLFGNYGEDDKDLKVGDMVTGTDGFYIMGTEGRWWRKTQDDSWAATKDAPRGKRFTYLRAPPNTTEGDFHGPHGLFDVANRIVSEWRRAGYGVDRRGVAIRGALGSHMRDSLRRDVVLLHATVGDLWWPEPLSLGGARWRRLDRDERYSAILHSDALPLAQELWPTPFKAGTEHPSHALREYVARLTGQPTKAAEDEKLPTISSNPVVQYSQTYFQSAKRGDLYAVKMGGLLGGAREWVGLVVLNPHRGTVAWLQTDTDRLEDATYYYPTTNELSAPELAFSQAGPGKLLDEDSYRRMLAVWRLARAGDT